MSKWTKEQMSEMNIQLKNMGTGKDEWARNMFEMWVKEYGAGTARDMQHKVERVLAAARVGRDSVVKTTIYLCDLRRRY